MSDENLGALSPTPAQPSPEEHYASRKAAMTEVTKPPVVIPEPPLADAPKTPEPKPEAVPEPKAQEAKIEDDDADTGEDDDSDADPEKDKPRRESRRTLKERNFQLREQKRALEAEKRALRAELDAVKPQPSQAAPEPVKADAKRPKQEDFASYDDYLDAFVDWKADQKFRTAETERATREQTARRQTEQQAKAQSFAESAEKARAKYDDWDDVVRAEDLHLSSTVAAIVADADNPGELAYWLGKNPAESRRISTLSPAKAAMELGFIERTKLGDSAAEPVVKRDTPKIPETKAPPPTKVVSGASARPAKALEELPQDDYYARRTAGLKGR